MNKKILLLIVLVIGIVALLFSIIAFPFIASVFDASPGVVSGIVGIFVLIFTFIFTFMFFKDRGSRFVILIPCFVFLLTSLIVNCARFQDYTYRHGYIVVEGGLYDSFGFSVISDKYGVYYMGYNELGDLVFLILEFDTEENEDDWRNHELRVKMEIYNSEGVFLGADDKLIMYGTYRELSEAKDDFKADLRKNGYERINARL